MTVYQWNKLIKVINKSKQLYRFYILQLATEKIIPILYHAMVDCRNPQSQRQKACHEFEASQGRNKYPGKAGPYNNIRSSIKVNV